MNFCKYFIDKFSWNISDSLVWVGLLLGVGGFDLVFVFDSFGSVGRENFKKGIVFVKIIIDEFGILKFKIGIRVVIVMYSLMVKVIFNLKMNVMFSKEEGIVFFGNFLFWCFLFLFLKFL